MDPICFLAQNSTGTMRQNVEYFSSWQTESFLGKQTAYCLFIVISFDNL